MTSDMSMKSIFKDFDLVCKIKDFFRNIIIKDIQNSNKSCGNVHNSHSAIGVV